MGVRHLLLRDFRFFVTLECVLAALSVRAVVEPGREHQVVALVAAVGAITICVVWMSRQQRAVHTAKARQIELGRLEKLLASDGFVYFHKVLPETAARIAKMRTRLPLVGKGVRVLPNPLSSSPFLKSMHVQQAIIASWVALAVMAVLRLVTLR